MDRHSIYTLTELGRLSNEINRQVLYVGDSGRDIWEVAYKKGDCEDIALAKRRALVLGGWPIGALRLCLCETNDRRAHAVLSVEADRATFVLDNLRPGVWLWWALPYRWLGRELPGQELWESWMEE